VTCARRRARPALLLLAGLLTSCGGLDKVYVGSKSFSESKLLAEMVALRAEALGIPVLDEAGLLRLLAGDDPAA
jgi:glycine betaine/choline ABC-type transport system substrate-binding protein